MGGPGFRFPGPVCQEGPLDGGTSALTLMPSPTSLGCNAAVDGPQTFHPAAPGTELIDPCLEAMNRNIEQRMLKAADAYYAKEDFRWFFTYAHAKITEQINTNLTAFQRPNALLRFNIHFAEEFLKAVAGEPHEKWKKAFGVCKAFEKGGSSTLFLVGEVELCGATMANVHIHIDLAAAIRDVGCLPPADYANMLVFVNRGALAATIRLRGKAVGVAETLFNQITAPFIGLEVKAWRNTVYQNACNSLVPDVEPAFSRRVRY
ncbi:MAG: hypothetical protein H8K07_08700 [Nitrospira sp.]|nr:hypothetical protein [Nitrospira sp.]